MSHRSLRHPKSVSFMAGCVLSVILSAHLVSSCVGEQLENQEAFTVDTTPSGIVRVNSVRPLWGDGLGWKLVQVRRIRSDDGGLGELSNPSGIAMDDQKRLYIAESGPARITVLDSMGRFLGIIGRDGEGPGEFREPMLAVSDSFLLVHDPALARISLFSASGDLIRTWPSTCCHYGRVIIDDSSRVVVPSRSPSDSFHMRFVRYSLSGEVFDTVDIPALGTPLAWEFRSGRTLRTLTRPFSPLQVTAAEPGGTILTGWAETYQFAVNNGLTDTVMTFGRTWHADPIAPERKNEVIERVVQAMSRRMGEEAARLQFRASDLPSTLPAFENVAIDAHGNRWVLAPSQGAGRPQFDIFNRGGVFLGTVGADSALIRIERAHWGKDDIVVLAEDSTGLPEIRWYQIDRSTN